MIRESSVASWYSIKNRMMLALPNVRAGWLSSVIRRST